MSATSSNEPTRRQARLTKAHILPPHPGLVRFLGNLDDLLQFVVGILLVITALILIGQTLWAIPAAIGEFPAGAKMSAVIHDIMLVMIVLELLWTVVTYLQEHTVPLEPFLFVGIISSARKLLLIGAQMSLTESGPEVAQLQMRELLVHGGLIFILVVALAIVRWTKRWRTKEDVRVPKGSSGAPTPET